MPRRPAGAGLTQTCATASPAPADRNAARRVLTPRSRVTELAPPAVRNAHMAVTELIEPLVDRAGQDVVLPRRQEHQAVQIAVDLHRVGVTAQSHIAQSELLQVQTRARADGELVETDDLMAWSSLYCRYRSLTRSEDPYPLQGTWSQPTVSCATPPLTAHRRRAAPDPS